MLEVVCLLPVSDQHSDRRRASIQSEDRIAIKDRYYRGSIMIPGATVGRGETTETNYIKYLCCE